jgi:hypothetical protein
MRLRGTRLAAHTFVVIALMFATAGCPSEPSPSAAVAPSASPKAALAASSATAPAVAPPTSATAAKDSPYPPVEDSCSKDTDCELVGTFRVGTKGCCSRCGEYTAGTRAWAASALSACQARGPCELAASCAEPTVRPFAAACSAGRCAVKSTK